MSKELKALNYLYNDLRLMKCLDIVEEAKIKSAYECLQQALQRLEAIDNAITIEPLKSLEKFFNNRKIYEPNNTYISECIEHLTTIKQYLIKQKATLSEIQTILDSWATSGLIADELALEQIGDVLKEMTQNERTNNI